MSKRRKKYVCIECGFSSESYIGKCPSCNTWESLKEEIDPEPLKKGFSINSSNQRPVSINNINNENVKRIKTKIPELDRVLGGGIVGGSLILIGGEPGIGKSTIVLQMAKTLGNNSIKTLYVSGEESMSQIKIRADRLSVNTDNILLYTENNIINIENEINNTKPDFAIIDSIQTMILQEINAVPGSLVQVRECASRLLRIGKSINLPILIVGHVTKDGTIAGPRVLEHMVDTVLYFEGEKRGFYRILRAVKNRFGSTDEIGIFKMEKSGLIEVKNPSEIFINKRAEINPGTVLSITIEGTRPFIIEVEGLAAYSPFPQPRRLGVGIDYNRMAFCIAVLEKKAGIKLSGQDVFLNIGGGIKINDPACDLAAAMAIYSSYREIPIPDKTAFIGEVALTGEIRPVMGLDIRIKEAVRFGLKKIFIPASQIIKNSSIEIIGVKSLREVIREVGSRK